MRVQRADAKPFVMAAPSEPTPASGAIEEAAGRAMLRWGAALEAVAEAALEAADGNPARCAWTKPSQMSRVVEVDGKPFAKVEIEEGTLRIITTKDATFRMVQ